MARSLPDGGSVMRIYVDSRHLELMLTRLQAALSSPELAGFLTTEVGPWLDMRAKQRFAGEGDDAVGPWAPLQPSTQMIRTKKGYGAAHPINVRTHELENYITGGTSVGNPIGIGARMIFPERGAPKPSIRKKLEVAQIGQNQHPRTVPRPVLGMNLTDLTFVLTRLSVYIAFKGQGKI
jgi:hypothetical protein